ncbi:Putative hydrolase or acyltransferase of alpha/beta superfamily [Idiomarina sp. A28L]|uniref:alpha/beta fold hydrolase n=1 Tax=Idiomarina sp. A28L TaxID=1036674 RepID=UPI0002138CF0|nr:alpha/beta hydrolase [Idiomarina sp. A28L]EGN74424.1 Putative hydrolase or acyltransferase of alpha/beta superfamily [Idiomarina sp. A28L]
MTSIVALHSSQSHSGQWRSLAKQLARLLPAGVSFYAPDLIGYGQGVSLAEGIPRDITKFRLTDELQALQAQDVPAPGSSEKVILIGHSYGGATALQWALRYPSQVQGLILYEPVSFHVLAEEEAARAEILAITASMEGLSLAESAAIFVDYWNQPGYFARLPEKAKGLMAKQQAKVQADFYALLAEETTLADYGQIKCPVVLLYGDESPLSSRTVAAHLAATLPNCQALPVHAGHMGPLVASDTVNPFILEALASMQVLEGNH